MAPGTNLIRVSFTHPRESGAIFQAEVALTCTGRQAIGGLVEAQFLTVAPQGQPYSLALARNGKQITANTTFADVGVADGDVLNVYMDNQGATKCG